MISRRTFLATAAVAAGSRPNILWLLTDEQRPDSLGCYNPRWAHSPCLDALAREGVLFESAYVPSPVCVPCRSSMLTGQAASATGVLHNQARLRADARFLTWRFEDAGYQTASFGKKHYFYPGRRQAFQTEGGRATDEIVDATRYGQGYNPADHDAVLYSPSSAQKEKRTWILAGRFPESEDKTAEARNVALAIDWLKKRDPSKPFLLRLSLNAPHTPVVTPAKYLDRIDAAQIDLPLPDEEELRTQPDRERVLLRGFEGSHVLTPAEIRKARHYYYGRAAFADAMIARLLESMRGARLLDNTIVVMTSDHGTHLADHGLLQKQTFYQQVATVPYIFWSPGRVRKGVRLKNPVNTLSVLPTLLELAGLQSDGQSLARSVREGVEPPRAPVFSEIAFGYQGYRDQDRQVMVRDGEWKLSIFVTGEADGALYNLRTDPRERRNLYKVPEYRGQVERLTRLIASRGPFG